MAFECSQVLGNLSQKWFFKQMTVKSHFIFLFDNKVCLNNFCDNTEINP